MTDGKKNLMDSPFDDLWIWMIFVFSLALLTVESFFLDLYYEEPTRLLVAVSMIENAQWLVPHILGEIYLKKPPGFNWIIALFSLPFGEVNRVSARIVSVISWGTIGYLTWDITEKIEWQGRLVALFSSLYSVIFFVEKAALAEIDLFFTALLMGAIYLFYSFPDRVWIRWIGSQFLFAMALLTKGPVAYLFFFLPVILYIWFQDSQLDWVPAFLGIFGAHLVALLWLINLLQVTGLEMLYETFYEEIFSRGEGSFQLYLRQLITYPLMIFLSLAPWSFLYSSLGKRNLRKTYFTKLWSRDLGKLVVAAITPIVIFYFFPVDRVRYVMPIFPWLAVSLGLVAESLIEENFLRKYFQYINYFISTVLVLLIFLPWSLDFEQSIISFQFLTIGSISLSILGFILLYWSYSTETFKTQLYVTLFVVLILKFGYLFLFIPVEESQRLRTSERIMDPVKSTKISKKSKVAFQSESNLDIPYYFHRSGYKIRKVTNSNRSQNFQYAIKRSSSEQKEKLAILRLPEGPNYYLFEIK